MTNLLSHDFLEFEQNRAEAKKLLHDVLLKHSDFYWKFQNEQEAQTLGPMYATYLSFDLVCVHGNNVYIRY